MKIQVIRTGKIAHQPCVVMAADYKKRLNIFIKSEDVEIKLDSYRDKRSTTKYGSKNNLKIVTPLYQPAVGEHLVVLDERGPLLTSLQVSAKLQQWIDDPRIKTLSFLVGPPYGFDEISKAAANEIWSLSAMTIPSDFAWLLVWEQLYRAVTILKGMPYHHD